MALWERTDELDTSSPTIQRDAIELVRSSDKPIAEIARDLASTTPPWKPGQTGPHRLRRTRGLTTTERTQLARLEAEEAKLRMERERSK